MDAADVLERARSGHAPTTWNVWPLRRARVRRAALGWVTTGVIGLGLLALMISIMYPDNFANSDFKAFFSTLMLMLVAVVGFGGLGIAIYDFWRLAHAGEYLLVITPEDYVKQEPRHTTHVPLEAIDNVTVRGAKPDEREQVIREGDNYQSLRATNALARIARGFSTPRQPKQAPSLAFVDLRTNKPVVVATDDSFDDIATIERVLSYLVDARKRGKVR